MLSQLGSGRPDDTQQFETPSALRYVGRFSNLKCSRLRLSSIRNVSASSSRTSLEIRCLSSSRAFGLFSLQSVSFQHLIVFRGIGGTLRMSASLCHNVFLLTSRAGLCNRLTPFTDCFVITSARLEGPFRPTESPYGRLMRSCS